MMKVVYEGRGQPTASVRIHKHGFTMRFCWPLEPWMWLEVNIDLAEEDNLNLPDSEAVIGMTATNELDLGV